MSISDAQQGLLRDLFAAVDARDTERFAGFLTEDVVFRFGSAPEVEGRDNVRQAIEGFYTTIAGLGHKLINTLAAGNILVCEGEVTYTRHDASAVTLPFANVFELEDRLISGYRIYIDIAPLYAE